MVQATTRARTIGIVMEIRRTSGPCTTSDATDEVVLIARGKETGIETARGGTPVLGTIRSSINHHNLRLPPPGSASDPRILLPTPCVFPSFTFSCLSVGAITKINHRQQLPVSIVLAPFSSPRAIVFFCLLPVSRCNLVTVTVLCRIV